MLRKWVNERARLAVVSLAVAAMASGAVLAADPPAAAKADAAATAGKKKSRTAAQKLTLVSPEIGKDNPIANDNVFNGMGCTGKNMSPALFWSGVPAGTKSFALMVHDPDAPTGSGFWHWVVYNIPADAVSIPAEAGDPKKPGMPKGAVQGRTDFGTVGYGGPCPPPGKAHHYHFHLFALKVDKLQVPADATAAMIGFNVNANKLAEADLVGTYGR